MLCLYIHGGGCEGGSHLPRWVVGLNRDTCVIYLLLSIKAYSKKQTYTNLPVTCCQCSNNGYVVSCYLHTCVNKGAILTAFTLSAFFLSSASFSCNQKNRRNKLKLIIEKEDWSNLHIMVNLLAIFCNTALIRAKCPWTPLDYTAV